MSGSDKKSLSLGTTKKSIQEKKSKALSTVVDEERRCGQKPIEKEERNLL